MYSRRREGRAISPRTTLWRKYTNVWVPVILCGQMELCLMPFSTEPCVKRLTINATTSECTKSAPKMFHFSPQLQQSGDQILITGINSSNNNYYYHHHKSSRLMQKNILWRPQINMTQSFIPATLLTKLFQQLFQIFCSCLQWLWILTANSIK